MPAHQPASLLNMLKPIALGQAGAAGGRQTLALAATEGDAGALSFSSLMAQQLDGTGLLPDAAVTADAPTLLSDAALPERTDDVAAQTMPATDAALPWGLPMAWVPPQALTPRMEAPAVSEAAVAGTPADVSVGADFAAGTSAVVASTTQATPLATLASALPDKASVQPPLPSPVADSNTSALLQMAGLMPTGLDAGKLIPRSAGVLGSTVSKASLKAEAEASKTTVSVSMGLASRSAAPTLPAGDGKAFGQALDTRTPVLVSTERGQALDDAFPGSKELMFNQFLTHAAGAFGQVQGQSASSVASFHAVEQLAHPVGSSQFVDELVGRVGMWVRGPVQNGPMTAELHMNPTDMGPVQVRIELDGVQAQVHFMASHADTRQAIEASLASLSNNLRDAGLQLTQANVSDASNGGALMQNSGGNSAMSMGSGNGQSRGSFSQPSPESQATLQAPHDAVTAPAQTARHSRGHSGLDMYA